MRIFVSAWFDHPRNWFYLLLPHKVAAEVLCDLMVVQFKRYAAFNWEFLTKSIVSGSRCTSLLVTNNYNSKFGLQHN